MKALKLYGIFVLLCLCITSCENTNENLVGERGNNVAPIVTNFKPGYFTTDFENSYIQFTVSLPEGESVDKGIVDVTLGSKTAQLQEISSFPATVKVKISDAANALGVPLANITTDSVFYVYAKTEKSGRVTRASSTSFKVKVLCAFEPEMTVGSYKEVSAGWEVSGNVTLVADASNANRIYIHGIQDVEGVSGTNPVAIDINPDTYAITGGSTVIAPSVSGYTNYTFTVVSGTYDPCDGKYSINFKISVDQGVYGTYNFVFTRN